MDLIFVFLYILPCVIIFLFVSIYLYFQHKYNYWRKYNIRYIKPQFIFGNIIKVMKGQQSYGDQIAEWYNICKEDGRKFIGIYNLIEPVLIPYDIKLIKNILCKDFRYFSDRVGYINEKKEPLTAHLFCLEVSRWKDMRNKITPCLSSGQIKQVFQIIVNCSEKMNVWLEKAVTNLEAVDMEKIATKYTSKVLESCILGTELNNNSLVQLTQKYLCPSGMDRINILLTCFFPSITKMLGIRHINKEIDEYFMNLAKYIVNQNTFSKDSYPSFLTNLSVEEIAAQIFLLSLAGYETGAITISSCLFELAKDQTIQDKVRDEIEVVGKKNDGRTTYESILEMHYLDKLVHETLRKYPPLPFLQRKVTKDYHLPDDGVVLRKGLSIFIPVQGIHNDAEFYPEPNKFDPDRFMEENRKQRPDFAFLPFGEGPKICVGQRFGLFQVKVGLCQLLSNYKFTPNQKTTEPLQVQPSSFVKKVKGGIWLNVEKINKI